MPMRMAGDDTVRGSCSTRATLSVAVGSRHARDDRGEGAGPEPGLRLAAAAGRAARRQPRAGHALAPRPGDRRAQRRARRPARARDVEPAPALSDHGRGALAGRAQPEPRRSQAARPDPARAGERAARRDRHRASRQLRVILWRVLPWDPSARPAAPGGALWFPRPFQGTGRHDDPARYGCLYVCESPVSAIAEALAPFRGTGDLRPELLHRMGRPLALAQLKLAAGTALIDLDDPGTLAAEALRPSVVATGRRSATQSYAAQLFEAHREAAGLRWWSMLEAAWINVTLFDRAQLALAARAVRPLDRGDADVRAAARFLGLD